MSRKALGKGLEALIGESPQEPVQVEEQPRQGLVKLKVDKIKSNPYQPRTKVDEEKLSELSGRWEKDSNWWRGREGFWRPRGWGGRRFPP
jgi:hypothetical protein